MDKYDYVSTYGYLWESMGLMEVYRNLCKYMGVYENLWINMSMGIYGSARFQPFFMPIKRG